MIAAQESGTDEGKSLHSELWITDAPNGFAIDRSGD
jgi:hypothetical protein